MKQFDYSQMNKVQKGKGSFKVIESRVTRLMHGTYGIVALESGRIDEKQMEAAWKVIRKKLKKVGSLYVRFYSSRLLTKKSTQSRMGKGKGKPWKVSGNVKAGRVLFEMSGSQLNRTLMKDIFKGVSVRLPINVGLKVVSFI